jgi:hypothetical protein
MESSPLHVRLQPGLGMNGAGPCRPCFIEDMIMEGHAPQRRATITAPAGICYTST